jgi:hypothetical protein
MRRSLRGSRGTRIQSHRKEAVCQWLVCGWKKEFDDFLKTCLSSAAQLLLLSLLMPLLPVGCVTSHDKNFGSSCFLFVLVMLLVLLLLLFFFFFSINPGADDLCFWIVSFSRPEYFSPFPGDRIFSCFGLSNSER